MNRIGHYYCENSKTGISDGDYSVDWADERMRTFAIWTKGMWAWAEYRTQKAAYQSLLDEFESVKKIEE